MLKDFTPGVKVEEAASIRLVKFLIYKFFKSNIVWKKRFRAGVLLKRRVFSFRRPFPFDFDGFISKSDLNIILVDDDYYILRHYKHTGHEAPVFCVSKEELLSLVNNLEKYCNYEYSYIFNKRYTWCLYIGDGTDEMMGIYYPLLPSKQGQ